MNVATIGILVAGSIAATAALVNSAYIVNEGNIAVITNAGRAVEQQGPAGLQFKTPFIMGVKEFDVRERALVGELTASTGNQLSTNIQFSVNWRPDPAQIMDIYINYGSPDDFAQNTIRPRLQQSLKATIGQFSGVELTRNREEVAAAMLENAQEALAAYPAILSSVQLENFTLPERYMEAVIQREEQREATEREQLRLEQQRITAQQAVQTAEAERDATIARAEGEAYAVREAAEAEAHAIRVRAIAEAEGIEAVQEAISDNPLLIEYERVRSWDGVMPRMMISDGQELLLNVDDLN